VAKKQIKAAENDSTAETGADLSGSSDRADSGEQQVKVASVAKAISILRLLGDAQFPLTMTEIARDAGLTPSSCHDLVSTLVQIGLVQQSSVGKCYELGARLVRIARSSMTPRGDFSSVQRQMNLIADKYDVNISLFKRFGHHSYISTQVSEGSAPIRIRISPGQVFPLLQGAVGLCFAAFGKLTPAELQGAGSALTTSGRQKKLDHEIEQTAQRGWAADRGRMQPGVGTIAVPVRRPDGVLVSVMELVTFQNKFDQAPIEAIIQDAQALAEQIASLERS